MVAIRAGGFVQILSKKFQTKHLDLTKCLVRGYRPVGEGIGSEAQNPDPRAQWPNLR
jgi:hypothetical protein